MKTTIRLELNSGKYVVVRLTRDRKYRKVTTGVTSSARHFDADRYGRWVSRQDADHERKNALIDESLTKARKALDEGRRTRGAEPSLEEIVSRMRSGEGYAELVAFMRRVGESQSGWNVRKGWGSSVRKLAEFLSTMGRTEIDFREVDATWLATYDNWMAENGQGASTRVTNLKRVRVTFNRAIADGVVPESCYPFKRGGFRMPRIPESKKERLTIEELKALASYETRFPGEAEARDTFLTQFYVAGARIEDILRLRKRDVCDGRVSFTMKKTGQAKSFAASGGLVAILAPRLEGLAPEDFVFSWLRGMEDAPEDAVKSRVSAKTALVNKTLKQVARKAGIEKRLTTHIARHSFAQHLVSQDVSLKVIQELLGHSSLSITQKYIDSFNASKTDAVMMTLPVL